MRVIRTTTAALALALLSQPLAWSQGLQARPAIVYQEKSLYRNILVTEHNNLRCMQFGVQTGRLQVQQTCMDLDSPERLVFDYAKAIFTSLYLTPNPQKILIIGLGGGTLPITLSSIDENISIDSVELDPAVISVAKSHFGFTPNDKSKAFDGDARIFVRQKIRENHSYDIVIIDAFERDYIPEHLLTREFLQQVKQILRPGGTLAANTYGASRFSEHEAATYQSVFGDGVYQLDLDSGNRLLFTTNGPFPSLDLIQDRAHQLDPILNHFGSDYRLFLPRLIQQAKAAPDTKVLTDQYSPTNLLLY